MSEGRDSGTRRQRVAIIFARELRDVLRDRRTLFTMLVVPILLYPALMLGFTRLTLQLRSDIREQGFDGALRIEGTPLDATSTTTSPLIARLLQDERFTWKKSEGDPAEAVRKGELELAVSFPKGFEERLARGEEVVIRPLFRSSDEQSRTAWQRFLTHVNQERQARVPLVIEDEGDLSSGRERGAQLFGGVLAMLVLFMALTGAFYPALDVAAGEKERGTLETLLLCPVSRRELVLGKYFTVLVVAVAAALFNLGSLAFTFRSFSSMLPTGGSQVGLSPGAFVIMLLGLVALAGVFSAVSLALSTFARSYKEGQSYLTPIFLVVLPLGMVGLLPGIRLTPLLAFVPVANIALLMKELLGGAWYPLESVITIVSLVALSVFALGWASRQFEREEVLFRGDGAPLFRWRMRGDGQSIPMGMALLAFFLALGVFFLTGTLLAPNDPNNLSIGDLVIPQNAAMATLGLLALVLTRAAGASPGRALRLGAPRSSRAWLEGLGLGLGGCGVSVALGMLQSPLFGDGEMKGAEALEKLIDLPWGLMLLTVSLLPAVAEELLCRGLFFRSARSSLSPRGAILFSAVLFGLLHMDPQRFLPQAVLGVLLALLVLRRNSLWPAVIAHALHNAVLASGGRLLGEERSQAFMIGLMALGLPLVALVFRSMNDADSEDSR